MEILADSSVAPTLRARLLSEHLHNLGIWFDTWKIYTRVHIASKSCIAKGAVAGVDSIQ